MDQREELARLIAPLAWRLRAGRLSNAREDARGESLSAADAILAAGWEKRSPAGEASDTERATGMEGDRG